MMVILKTILTLSFSLLTYASLLNFEHIVKNFDVTEARKLMASDGFDVNAFGTNGTSLLFDVVEEVISAPQITEEQFDNAVQIIQEILEHSKLDVYSQNYPLSILEMASIDRNRGHRLIHILLKIRWDLSIIEKTFANLVLLNADIKLILIFLQNRYGPRNFTRTCQRNNYRLIRLLLEHEKTCQSATIFSQGMNLLNMAVEVAVYDMDLLEEICKEMARLGNLNRPDDYGNTPLMTAIRQLLCNDRPNIPFIKLLMGERYGVRIPKTPLGEILVDTILDSLNSELSYQLLQLLIQHKEIEFSWDDYYVKDRIINSNFHYVLSAIKPQILPPSFSAKFLPSILKAAAITKQVTWFLEALSWAQTAWGDQFNVDVILKDQLKTVENTELIKFQKFMKAFIEFARSKNRDGDGDYIEFFKILDTDKAKPYILENLERLLLAMDSPTFFLENSDKLSPYFISILFGSDPYRMIEKNIKRTEEDNFASKRHPPVQDNPAPRPPPPVQDNPAPRTPPPMQDNPVPTDENPAKKDLKRNREDASGDSKEDDQKETKKPKKE